MKKKLLIILLCGVVTITLTGCIAKRNYELNLRKEEKINNISIEKDNNKVEISNLEEIKDIINVLNRNGKGRTTKEESIQDYPVNAEEVIKIEFKFKEKGSSILFIYKKKSKNYIEVPYSGIYKINEDEYNSIEKYIK